WNCARALLVRWGCGLAGALLASAVILGFFILRDGGRHLWECTMRFNQFYASSGSFGMEALWARVKMYWGNWWVLWVLAGVGMVVTEKLKTEKLKTESRKQKGGAGEQKHKVESRKLKLETISPSILLPSDFQFQLSAFSFQLLLLPAFCFFLV